ncbi:MAG TPA: PRC-barrel domain-containing protein, partial [Burkholderiales bacterium]|nr:PRC-barrel domain-containing protein [Burkholderiales bacterium]
FTGIEDDVAMRAGQWRVNALIGEHVSLNDAPRHGIVDDVIFDVRGQARGVIVDRAAGRWGEAGWYGYPYAGYHPGGLGWPMPHASAEVAKISAFSYAELGRHSPYASHRSPRAEQEQMERARLGERLTLESAPPLAELYAGGWSAEQMIGTAARGAAGEDIGTVRDLVVSPAGLVERVVVGASGLFGLGQRFVDVPWNEVRIGPAMAYVQTPVRAENVREFSLFTGLENEVRMAPGAWRVNELLGEFASLEDVERYGIVSDVIFDERGQARAVIVARGAGWWGGPDWYAFPYVGFDRAADAYPLPYRSADIGALPRFDYVELSELSPFSLKASP